MGMSRPRSSILDERQPIGREKPAPGQGETAKDTACTLQPAIQLHAIVNLDWSASWLLATAAKGHTSAVEIALPDAQRVAWDKRDVLGARGDQDPRTRPVRAKHAPDKDKHSLPPAVRRADRNHKSRRWCTRT